MSDNRYSVRFTQKARCRSALRCHPRLNPLLIVENKRLVHALALVKAQQDLRYTTRVMTNSEKTGYRKRTRIVSAPLPVLSHALDS